MMPKPHRAPLVIPPSHHCWGPVRRLDDNGNEIVIAGRKRTGFSFEYTAQEFREAMREEGARALVPSEPIKLIRRLQKKIGPKVAALIHGNPIALRRFAERVRDGALGTFASWVYFIGHGADGPIKIGVSINPEGRLSDLQSSTPAALELICAVNGDVTVERMIHDAFGPDHIRGEWFRRSETLSDFIRVLMLRSKFKRG